MHLRSGARSDHDRTIACNEEECPVDCVWSQWTGWSPCSTYCGPGVETRSRRILTNDAYGGVPCVGVDYEEAVCQARECPVDCEWAEWGPCKCPDQQKERSRMVKTHARCGGQQVEGAQVQSMPCEKPNGTCSHDQPRQNCKLSEWSAWSECDCGIPQRFCVARIRYPSRALRG